MKNLILIAMASMSFTSYCEAQKKQTANSTINNKDSVLFSAMSYRNIGPFRGGRSCTATGILKDRNTYFMGATGGGVWKTTDGGSNWKNISDKYF